MARATLEGGILRGKDRQRKTVGVVEMRTSTKNYQCDGGEHGTFNAVVYVCALRIREVIPFSLEKKDHIYLTGMLTGMKNWRVAVAARSARVGFVLKTVITSAGLL